MNGITSTDILAALRKHHTPRYNGTAANWVVFDELRTGAGFDKGSLQGIDMWAMNCWPSTRAMIAYEVKVSRSDFLVELKKPTKRKLALFYSNQFYFATPKGLIKHAELPPECGLIELTEKGQMRVAVEAPWRECHPPSWHFVASIARRVQRLTHEWGPNPDERPYRYSREGTALEAAGWEPGKPLPPEFLSLFEVAHV